MKTWRIVTVHVVYWVLFVILPMLMFNMDNFGKSSNYSFWTHITILNFISFYLAYFILVPWIMSRKRLVSIILVSLLWLICLTTLRSGINYIAMEVLNFWAKFPFSMEKQLTLGVFNAIVYSFNAILIYFSIEWYKERQYRSELVKEKQKSEIDLLKSQMNPHFLMNTLNNLYSLVYQGSSQASDAVLKLSDIMRYMLYDTSTDVVPLENEVRYLKSFIDLEMLRFGNQELVDFEVNGDISGKLIAPMVLIPFVENAFKHGNKFLPGMGIRVKLDVIKDDIIFEVMNFKASKDINKDQGTGIGLQNIRKRLELQYPGRHSLEITDGMDYFNVYLTLKTR